MKPFNLNYKPLGKNALLIEWPNCIEEQILKDIISLQFRIETEFTAELETVNAYNSLTLILNAKGPTVGELEERVRLIYQSDIERPDTSNKIWKIPVCYDEEFGIDLKEIADLKKTSVDEVISLHCAPDYLVYFTGFLPGFLYLGGLPEKLHVSRKSTPRLQIKKGAVAIGGQQTGIYPAESPGGWNIIGNSPLNFFDPRATPPCFAVAGDRLKFYAIEKGQYDHVASQVAKGTFELECEIT